EKTDERTTRLNTRVQVISKTNATAPESPKRTRARAREDPGAASGVHGAGSALASLATGPRPPAISIEAPTTKATMPATCVVLRRPKLGMRRKPARAAPATAPSVLSP